jgi:hypothetical protein
MITSTSLGIALGQLDEEFRGGVFDTPSFKDTAFGGEDAKIAASLTRLCLCSAGSLRPFVSLRSSMEVDSDGDWIVVGCGWFGHKTAHPTTSISSGAVARFACRSTLAQDFICLTLFLTAASRLTWKRQFAIGGWNNNNLKFRVAKNPFDLPCLTGSRSTLRHPIVRRSWKEHFFRKVSDHEGI